MIVIDWGSTSLRAYRLGTDGEIIEQRRAALGILACTDRFEAALKQQIAGWDDALVILTGMIGSRQGWIEVPYVNCPATLTEIAAGMMPVSAPGLHDRNVWIVPGLLCRTAVPQAADVMRGEETQLCGLLEHLDAARHIVCLPGTHSKWAIVDQGRIESFFTAMTGEVFDLLRRRSLLARLMTEGGDSMEKPAFIQGIARAGQPGGLLHHLFSVRTAGLMETLQPTQLASYLSGLLIGHELLDSQWAGQARATGVHLVGGPALIESYLLAMHQLGIAAEIHDETLAARGAHALARCRNLLGERSAGHRMTATAGEKQ